MQRLKRANVSTNNQPNSQTVHTHTIQLPAETIAEKAADNIIGHLQEAGHAAFRVGGAVRDRLIGNTPAEVDVATDAVPQKVRSLFRDSYAVGESFGVIIVHTDQGADVEVATFREERGYADGRHPEHVSFSTPEKDAQRRDFTINAFFYDPFQCQVLDFVNGKSDLDDGIIRAIGDPDERFREDHLRMLRAVRFAAKLKFTIDSDTAQACRDNAHDLANISAERVYTELTLMLASTYAAVSFCMLRRFNMLSQWLPEVEAMKGVEQPPEFHPEGDVWQHTLLMLGRMQQPSKELGWSVLLHDVGKPPTQHYASDRIRFPKHAEKGADMAGEILRRLKASKQMIESVMLCIKNHMAFVDVPNMKLSTLRRLIGRPTFDIELELHRLDCISSHRKLDNYQFLLDKKKEFDEEPVLPEPLVRGEDILALGIEPGPLVGELLEQARDWQLQKVVTDKKNAVKKIKQYLKDKHGIEVQ